MSLQVRVLPLPSIDPEWLLKMAEKEDNKIISVGGLVTRLSPTTMIGGILNQPDPMTGEPITITSEFLKDATQNENTRLEDVRLPNSAYDLF